MVVAAARPRRSSALMAMPLAFAGIADTPGSAARNGDGRDRSRPTNSTRIWSVHKSSDTMLFGRPRSCACSGAVARTPMAQTRAARSTSGEDTQTLATPW